MVKRELHSVVVPMFNEAQVVEIFHDRITAALRPLPDYELIVVDDGSGDQTYSILQRLAQTDRRLRIVRLSRNFGHQTAITAGIDLASGDTVTVIDADLQDPPELIPELIARWREGADIVFAIREKRMGESWFKRTTASVFYRLLVKIARTDIPLDAGDFRLMSRKAVEGLKAMREHSRYIRGLVGWIGLERAYVTYRRDPRAAGETKYPLAKMLRLAADGIVSFSTRPLQLATLLGMAAAGLAFLYAAYVLWMRFASSAVVEGWSSLMIVVLFLGGVQLLTVGIIGEYIGRIYDEVRSRPLYMVNEVSGFPSHISTHLTATCVPDRAAAEASPKTGYLKATDGDASESVG